MSEPRLPKQGTPREELFARMREGKKRDADWRGGRTWSLIYPAGEEVDSILAEANELYMYENALNPFRFPSLRQMETDVVSMTAGLLHGENAGAGEGGLSIFQSLQAQELIARLSTEPLPLVLVGDFNSDPNDSFGAIVTPYTQLTAAGYADAWNLRTGPAVDGSTCCRSETLDDPNSVLSERIDQVWVHAPAVGPVQARVLGTSRRDRTPSGLWPSDHAGVAARVHLKLPH